MAAKTFASGWTGSEGTLVGDAALVLGSVALVDGAEESVGAGSIDCPVDGGAVVGSGELVPRPDEPLLHPATAVKLNVARPSPARSKTFNRVRGRPAADGSARSAGACRCKRAKIANRFCAAGIAVAAGVPTASFSCVALPVASVAVDVMPRRTCISVPQSVPMLRNVAAHTAHGAGNANQPQPKRIVTAPDASQVRGTERMSPVGSVLRGPSSA